MGRRMGIGGPGSSDACFQRNFRWGLLIDNVIGIDGAGTNILPPLKSHKPIISFREIEEFHLTEMIHIPGRPDWRPIDVTCYSMKTNGLNPIYKWLTNYYNPKKGTIGYYRDFVKPKAMLQMYDGCGNIIEKWTYENVYPISVDFGDLDMATSHAVTCTLQLRYARAYIDDGSGSGGGGGANGGNGTGSGSGSAAPGFGGDGPRTIATR